MVVSLLAHRRLCYVERKNSLSALWKTKVSNFVSFIVLQMFCSVLLNKSTAVDLFFTITWKTYERNWLYFPLRKRARYI